MTQTNTCSVSVIIPFYNASSSIRETLRSVFNQTLLPSEIIVVDDGSVQAESHLLKGIIEDFNAIALERLKLELIVLSENRGVSYARNVAIENSTMKYLAFLDSDDVWAENKIEIQFCFMENYSYKITGHGYIFNLNEVGFSSDEVTYSRIKKYHFIYSNHYYTPTVMAIRDGFKCFDSNFDRAEDYKCWVENVTSGGAIIHNKLAGGFKRPLGESGLSRSIVEMHRGQRDVLCSLYSESVISKSFYWVALLIEFIKFPLRVIRLKVVDLVIGFITRK